MSSIFYLRNSTLWLYNFVKRLLLKYTCWPYPWVTCMGARKTGKPAQWSMQLLVMENFKRQSTFQVSGVCITRQIDPDFSALLTNLVEGLLYFLSLMHLTKYLRLVNFTVLGKGYIQRFQCVEEEGQTFVLCVNASGDMSS